MEFSYRNGQIILSVYSHPFGIRTQVFQDSVTHYGYPDFLNQVENVPKLLDSGELEKLRHLVFDMHPDGILFWSDDHASAQIKTEHLSYPLSAEELRAFCKLILSLPEGKGKLLEPRTDGPYFDLANPWNNTVEPGMRAVNIDRSIPKDTIHYRSNTLDIAALPNQIKYLHLEIFATSQLGRCSSDAPVVNVLRIVLHDNLIDSHLKHWVEYLITRTDTVVFTGSWIFSSLPKKLLWIPEAGDGKETYREVMETNQYPVETEILVLGNLVFFHTLGQEKSITQCLDVSDDDEDVWVSVGSTGVEHLPEYEWGPMNARLRNPLGNMKPANLIVQGNYADENYVSQVSSGCWSWKKRL